MNDSKPKRRWLRISIRGLLFIITVLGVFLGVWTNTSRKQKAAAEALRALGAEITYTETRFPTWLVEQLGEDFLCRVEEVHIHKDVGENEIDLKRIANLVHQLPSGASMHLSLVISPRSGLLSIGAFSDRLVSLDLRSKMRIHVVDLEPNPWRKPDQTEKVRMELTELSKCPNLQTVSISELHLDELHFSNLGQCDSLKTISLWSCNFECGYLSRLRELPDLHQILLGNCEPSVETDGKIRFKRQTKASFFGSSTTSNDEGVSKERFEAWRKETLPDVEFLEITIL